MSLSGFSLLTCQASSLARGRASPKPRCTWHHPSPMPSLGAGHTQPLEGLLFMLESPCCLVPLTWYFLTPFLPLTSWLCLLSIKNPRDVAHIPLGPSALKEDCMQIFSCTIISTETSNQMAMFLGLAEQNWLFGIKQAGTELRDCLLLPEIPDCCSEAAGHMGQGLF